MLALFSSLTLARTAKIDKHINDALGQIEDMEEKKRQFKLLITPRKATAKLGEFSAEVSQAVGRDLPTYSHGGRQIYQGSRESLAQHDHFSHLPVELLRMVSNLLKTPDRVMLALTSKLHMGVFESTRGVPQKRGAIARTARLAVLVRLLDWMPSGVTLCYACIKFLPSAKNGPWGGDSNIRKKKLANLGAINSGPRCIHCVRRDDIESVKAHANAHRLKQMVRGL